MTATSSRRAACLAGPLLLAVAAGPLHAQQARQAFPVKPIRLVASTTPGSQPDGIARLLAREMSLHWDKPVVVDNRPAANGTLAAAAVAKGTPDGHTLLYVLPQFVISAATQPSLPYDPRRDFAPSAQIGFSTNVLVVAPQLGVKSVRELIALAQAQPGKLIFGSGATGSAGHLSGARFNLAAGIKVIHVAFKGGPDAVLEIIAGRSHYTVGTMGVVLPFIREGKLTALATTSARRSPALPEVPPLADTLAEFKNPEIAHGLLLPAGTPPAVVGLISRELARDLELPDLKERFAAISFEAAYAGPDDYARLLRAQLDSTLQIVRDAGLKPK